MTRMNSLWVTAAVLWALLTVSQCPVISESTTQDQAKRAAYERTVRLADTVMNEAKSISEVAKGVEVSMLPEALKAKIEDLAESQAADLQLAFEPSMLVGARIQMTAEPDGSVRLELTRSDGHKQLWVKTPLKRGNLSDVE